MKQKLLILFIFINYFFLNTQAQPGAIDLSFNTTDNATENGNGPNEFVKSIVTQNDGKIIIVGDFTFYNGIARTRIARLNADGSLDTGFNPGTGANNSINSVALQSDGKIIIGGSFTTYNGTARKRIARLNSDGSLDVGFVDNSGSLNGLAVNSIAIQSDGKIIIGGDFGYYYSGPTRHNIARFNIDGSLDIGFNLVDATVTGLVNSVALQSDGKILVGGNLFFNNGVDQKTIVRLNSNGGLDTGFNPGTGANKQIQTVTLQSGGEILICGDFTSYNGVSRNGFARLNANGSLDTGFISGTTATSVVARIICQNDGKIIIAGQFTSYNGTARINIARLNADGSLDTGFNPGTGPNNLIHSLALQSDGKILIGGYFSSYNGTIRNNVARLNTNSSIDIGFNRGTGANNAVQSIVVQNDGKILIGGQFTSYNGTNRNGIARLNADGSLDTGFNPGTGIRGIINPIAPQIALQNDGKILIAGYFTSFNGMNIKGIVRLNADGSLDTGFNSGTGVDGAVYSLALQSDGKIIIGGHIGSYNGTNRNGILRLNTNGSLDTGFNPGTGTDVWVYSVSVQNDGKIIIGGNFTSYNGTARNKIARLNADGSLDTGFNPGTGADNPIQSVAFQSDGKILIGGSFLSYNGTARNKIARLNADGSLDTGFNSGAATNNSIQSVALQSDGKILIGGAFSTYSNGLIARNGIARLNSDGSLDTGFYPEVGINSAAICFAFQNDGKILIGGYFYTYNEIGKNRIARVYGSPVSYNNINGFIYSETNNDCTKQSSEKFIPSMMTKALPGPFFGGTNNLGNYRIEVDSGAVSYTITQQFNALNSKLLINQCSSSHTVKLAGSSKDTCCFNFADSIKECSLLNINVQNSRMVRCFRNNTYVNYCNYGNSTASGTQIKVEYPSYIIPISSTPMWTSKSGSTLIYNIGTIAEGACGKISIIDSVICGNQSILGLTQCIKASISPSSNCIAEDPNWDRSSMKIIGTCVNDSANFVIQNTGAGNMASNHDYRVFVNDTLIFTGTYTLNSGEQFIAKYPSQGNTIRLEADQHPLHPGKSRPRATVEGCGLASPALAKKRLVTTAPQDDLDEEVATTCNVIRGSYDPNDKQTIPSGIGATNQIVPGEELEYTIRFQNTGTDTAYTVTVVDTINANLDPSSFLEGVSSHPYTLKITGKGQAVLSFNFYNINLPDSTTSKPNSNGLVSFRITVPASTPLGTAIKNKAYIYFDYNSPILTNETIHTVGMTVEQDLSKGEKVTVGNVTTGITSKSNSVSAKLYPNPTTGIITLEMSNIGKISEMYLYSTIGVLKKIIPLTITTSQQVILGTMSEGMYLYEIRQDGERVTGGMLQVR